MKKSPTARSLEWLRDRGWIADKVEQRLPMKGKPWCNTKDLWGFVDIAAVHPEGRLLFVQVTSTGNLQSRVHKATEVAVDALVGLISMNEDRVAVEFHGWAKRGPRGKRKVWTLKRLDHTGREIP